MQWTKKWWGLLIVILAVAFVIGWKEERCQSQAYQCRATYAAQAQSERLSGAVSINQQASEDQAITAACEPNGYFCRLFSAANLPTMLLVFIGMGGVYVAISTLKIIERQTKATEEAERAWVLVETAQIREIYYQVSAISPIVRNFGKSITRVRKIRMGFCALQITEELPPVPIYTQEQETDFVLHPNRECRPIDVSISNAGLQAAVDGLKLLYIYGVIEYLAGQTRFCLVYSEAKGDIPAGFYPAVKAPGAYTHYI
jgi:hypothetical protein